jgi:arsenical pump membrane protein
MTAMLVVHASECRKYLLNGVNVVGVGRLAIRKRTDVQGIENTGALASVAHYVPEAGRAQPAAMALIAGSLFAVLCNIVNNLPLGLIAGSAAGSAHLPACLLGALLIGVDVGPNLSVTGSLATILWLLALRRERLAVSAWTFFRLGCLVMPPALIAALASFAWLTCH